MRIPAALSTLIHARSSALKPLVAACRLGAYRCGMPVAIRHADDLFPSGMVFVKDAAGRLTVQMDRNRLARDRGMFSTLWKRAGVFVDLISDREIGPGAYVCDLGDFCSEPGPVLAFCSSNPENVLVPDRTFFLKNGYAADRRLAAGAAAWSERDDTVLWRGGLNGSGVASAEPMTPQNELLLQRVRLCLAARGIPGTDIKIPVGGSFDAGLGSLYRSLGIAGSYAPQSAWIRRKSPSTSTAIQMPFQTFTRAFSTAAAC